MIPVGEQKDWRGDTMVYEAISKLVQYGLDTGLITEVDRVYATNQILDVLHMDEYEETEPVREPVDLEAVLKELMDYAHETGVMPEDPSWTILHTGIFLTQGL